MESNSELRQRLYSPPILLKFDLHHSDDDDGGPTVGFRDRGGIRTAADVMVSIDGRSARPVVVVASERPSPPPDDRGCLAPCFPACHTPVYRAGQVITGHLLVRPVTRLVISGRFSLVCCFCDRVFIRRLSDKKYNVHCARIWTNQTLQRPDGIREIPSPI